LPHFVGRFVGESHRQNARSGYAMGFHEVGDPVRNHTSFAAPRPSEQKKRTFDVCDSLLLLRIETLEEIHGVGVKVQF